MPERRPDAIYEPIFWADASMESSALGWKKTQFGPPGIITRLGIVLAMTRIGEIVVQKRVVVETVTGPLAGIPRIVGCLKIGPNQPVQPKFLRVNLGDHVGDAELIRQNKTYVWYREIINETQGTQLPGMAVEPVLRMRDDGNHDEPGPSMA